MNYGKFAYLYDELMTDAPYEQWVSFVLDIMKNTGNYHRQILDVGCGTGNIAIPLSKHGLQVTAVDLSEEMLFVAKEKSDAAKAEVQFFQQDMRELEGLGEFDVVISLCDCINYLNNEQEINVTFQRISHHLKKNGLFIFDVHSIHKVEAIFTGHTFAHNGQEISYIWECFAGEEEYSVDHDLSFFVENEEGMYERYDEFHKQRTYTIETYEKALKNSGFEVISITGDFSLETLEENAERWFFVTKKI
ncbi:class I SAM-dependent DNA methyltransferase [Anaerobacillus isosaccharinicus]|uniref:SAM-dependent methyltransferase n=1 Tax=Anaerobacillus isosaccharinicus TaxID=1532552 RepID=A0A1S2LSB5_9BACI|nr:class I SAM-dependent methyltransferase [Anaerobacillus isosaccharinicus]MBA5585469.1 class I SAM-dependent methyltransferase [Anaerobacillus isosaccharinicus]QOY36214.1 class I SAM-dependent methyltransferase [Anaerobacillus isosaccharinicus]